MREKILIIDDNKDILFSMKAICDFQKWDSVLCTNVKDALEKLKEEQPDIILIDYHLPIINGIEGVKMIRQIDKDTPIIVLTVEEDQKIANKFIESGACDFALKPIKAPDIISRIKVHIRLKNISKDSNKSNYEYAKGISAETLEKIMDFMKNNNKFISLNQISKETGLAYQTVHRYLQYLEDKNLVDIEFKYGKLGRPRKKYKIK